MAREAGARAAGLRTFIAYSSAVGLWRTSLTKPEEPEPSSACATGRASEGREPGVDSHASGQMARRTHGQVSGWRGLRARGYGNPPPR